MNLEVEILQQNGNDLMVGYKGTSSDGLNEFSIDRKVRIKLPTLASIDLVREAIKLSVKSDYLQHRYVGFKFDMLVNDDDLKDQT